MCTSIYTNIQIHTYTVISSGAVRSAASSYAAMRMVAGSCLVLVIAWEWHISLALLCGCSGALEYPTTNSWGPINESLSLILILMLSLPLFHTSCTCSDLCTPSFPHLALHTHLRHCKHLLASHMSPHTPTPSTTRRTHYNLACTRISIPLSHTLLHSGLW